MIIGDSYSTYKGYIPEGYSFYYCEEGVRPDLPGSKMLVEDTWWGRLIKNTDANLILNDSWANAPLGEMQYSGWEKEDLFNVLPAICYLMHRLKQDNPDTRIIFIGNSGLKAEIIDCMRDAAEQVGVEFIELGDVEKENVHPTILGMEQIYDQIMQKLNG